MKKQQIIGVAFFLILGIATQAHALQATVTWTNPTDTNRTSIKVLRQDGGTGAFVNQTVTPLAATATSFNQSGLIINTQYCYQVVPSGALGDAVSPATTCGTPNSPINVNGITIIFQP